MRRSQAIATTLRTGLFVAAIVLGALLDEPPHTEKTPDLPLATAAHRAHEQAAQPQETRP